MPSGFSSVGRAIVFALIMSVVLCAPCLAATQLHGEVQEKQIKKMRALAFDGKEEIIVFLVTTANGTEVFIPKQNKNTQTSADFEYSQLRRFLKSKKSIRKLVYIHTHPLRGLSDPNFKYKTPKEVGEIQKDPQLLSPLPPSTTDFATLAEMEVEFGHSKALITEHWVIDPTGIWKYRSLYEAGSALDNLITIEREYRAAKKIYRSKGKNATDEEMNRAIDKQMESETFMWFSKPFKEVSKTQEELFKLNGSADAEAKQVLVEEYIRRVKEAGIEVSYEPFEK